MQKAREAPYIYIEGTRVGVELEIYCEPNVKCGDKRARRGKIKLINVRFLRATAECITKCMNSTHKFFELIACWDIVLKKFKEM